MKKTISLIVAILLSITVFTADMAGIAMIVRADDVVMDEGDDGYQDPDFDPDPEEPYIDPSDPSEPDPGDDPAPPVIDPDQEEQKRQAEEKAAEEARKAAEQAAADAAAKEAQKQAEEQAKKAAEEAAKAQKAAEEAAKAAQEYSLVASASSVNFGTASIGDERDVIPLTITNTGSGAVDLIYTETGDANGAFSMNVRGDKTHLEPRESADFYVSMSSSLPAGSYRASLKFADATRDPQYSKGVTVGVTGTVSSKQHGITSVTVNPSKISLAIGGSAQFTADIDSDEDRIYTVIWTVNGNRSGATDISSKGVLTVANDETAPKLTVMATVAEDPTQAGTATVTLQQNSYNVTAAADPSNGGSVTGGGAVVEGGSVTLSAIPNRNFYFKGWVIDGKTVSTATNLTISDVHADVRATAQFGQNSVTIRADVNNDHAGNVVGGGTVSYGGSTTLSAKAYDGYVFVCWKEGDQTVSRDASLKLSNCTVDRKFTAYFEKTRHTLTVCAYPVEGGSVTGGGTFKLNEGTTIQASANNGYSFQGWQVNGQWVSRSAIYTIDKIKSDYTCTAIFAKNGATMYEMSAGVATTGGSITPSGKFMIASGQNVTYTITPKSGFAILAVAVDGMQVGPVATYTFTNIQSNHMIAAAFVQTDAGKKAAESSGNAAQDQKVKPLPKTPDNTATNDSTVDIDKAASGEGGDNYVEEMDLSNVQVPTDEQLGITVEKEEADSDVVKSLGMTMDQVSTLVSEGDTMPILDAAFYSGGLSAHVYNKFEPEDMTSVDYNKMTREELMLVSDDVINPSLPDLDVVVQKMLSTDDVMRLAKGGHVDISVSLTGLDNADDATKRIMKNAVGQKPLKYFDLTMLKSVDGNTERVTELPTTMEVVIEIPQEIYQEGKTYSVLRVHDGELTVLPDLDDNPRTITFRTDRFSSYAISKEVATMSGVIGWLVGGAALALGVAITCFLILVAHHRRMRKMKRKAAHG